MALQKFLVPPDAPAYTVTDGIEAARTQLDGGKGRYRSDTLNASYTVKVSWTFTKAKFNYFQAFWKSVSVGGSMPFLIDLITDSCTELEEHTVHIVPGSVTTSAVVGHSFKVDAQLEVMPIIRPEGYYEAEILAYEIAGEDVLNYDLSELLNQLNQFTNVDLPALEVFDA